MRSALLVIFTQPLFQLNGILQLLTATTAIQLIVFSWIELSFICRNWNWSGRLSFSISDPSSGYPPGLALNTLLEYHKEQD